MTGMDQDTTLRLDDRAPRRDRAFRLAPDAPALDALARRVGADAVRKVTFEGRLTPEGRADWRLEAHLGATVVQPCVVTLAPVTTRIETDLVRRYVEGYEMPDDAGEHEMPDDDTVEPRPAALDLAEVLAEALSLAMPDFPKAEGAELAEAQFTEPGRAAMTDDDAKPLAGLRDLLKGGGSD